MAVFNIYFSSCVLLLLLTLTLNSRTSTGLPVRALSSEQSKDCSLQFRELLLNVTQLLSNDFLCYGIPTDKIVLKSRSVTAIACAPSMTEKPGCMMQRNLTFSESECMKNIMKDLAHYSAAIKSYLILSLRNNEKEEELLKPTLRMIQSLRKNCSLMPDEEEDPSEAEAAQLWGDDSFINRKEMCEMMRGFHVRTITINRAMGYIASGDHKK